MAGYRELKPTHGAPPSPPAAGGYREMLKKRGERSPKASILAKDRANYVTVGKKSGPKGTYSAMSKKSGPQSGKSTESVLSTDSTALPSDYKPPQLIVDPRYLIVSETSGLEADDRKKLQSPVGPQHGRKHAPFFGRHPQHGGRPYQRSPYGQHGAYGAHRPQFPHYAPPQEEEGFCTWKTCLICLCVIIGSAVIVGITIGVFVYFKARQDATTPPTTSVSTSTTKPSEGQ